MTCRRLGAWIVLILIAPGTLHTYDPDLWTHLTSQNVVTSIEEGEGEIFFGTSGGVRRYHRFKQDWLRTITTAEGLPDNFVQQLAYDAHTGDLEIRTRTGSARWMSRLETLTPGGIAELDIGGFLPRIPSSIFPPFGYYINGHIIRGPHRDYRILDAKIDSWNILWLATEGLGIGRADLTFNELEFIRSGPLTPNVTAIELDGDTVWMAGRGGFGGHARGISRYDRESDKWEYFEQRHTPRLDETQIADIEADSADVWFATENGVVRYRRANDSWDTYRYSRASSTRHIRYTASVTRGRSRVWLGTERGLAVLDLGVDTLRAVPGSNRFRIRDLATGNRHVWAATNKGLFRCASDDITWEPVKDHPAAEQSILAVDATGDTTWALTTTPPRLLFSSHPDSSWTVIDLPEAAGSTRARISAAGARAWVGTDFGIVRVNTRSGKATTLNSIDGLLDDAVQAIRLDGDIVWVGTRAGASIYRWVDDFRDPGD